MPRVCIDPGHGGRSPGAIGANGLKEKDVVLVIAKKIAKYLPSVELVYTRDTDQTVELRERSDIANKAKADCLVSIHCNGAIGREANGVETYCYQTGGEGEKLAKSIQKYMVLLGLTDRGVKTKNLHMLRETIMPAALVEVAFISNPKEEELLSNDEFQEKAAKAVADGLIEYFGLKLHDNIVSWARDAVEKAVAIGLVNNPELLTESEQKVLVWFDRLGLFRGAKT